MLKEIKRRNLAISKRIASGEWPHNIAREYGLKTVTVYGIYNRMKREDVKVNKIDRTAISYRVKLDNESVYNMRMEFAYSNGSLTYADMAKKFGVSYTTAFNAICGFTWKNADGPTTMPAYLEGRLKFNGGCVC
jgi:Mor family transcriptional regulator